MPAKWLPVPYSRSKWVTLASTSAASAIAVPMCSSMPMRLAIQMSSGVDTRIPAPATRSSLIPAKSATGPLKVSATAPPTSVVSPMAWACILPVIVVSRRTALTVRAWDSSVSVPRTRWVSLPSTMSWASILPMCSWSLSPRRCSTSTDSVRSSSERVSMAKSSRWPLPFPLAAPPLRRPFDVEELDIVVDLKRPRDGEQRPTGAWRTQTDVRDA